MPEPVHGGVEVRTAVGVGTLPFIKVEGSRGERLERVLGLGLGSRGLSLLSLLFLLFNLLLNLLLGLLLGLDLTGLQLLSGENNVTENSLEGGLVGASNEPTNDVGVLGTGLLIKNKLEGIVEGRDDGDVSESDGFTDEVSLQEQVAVEDSEGLVEVGNCGLVDILVVVGETEDRVNPLSHGSVNFLGSELQPLVDLSRLEEALSEELSVGAELSNVTSDGVRLGDSTETSLKSRDTLVILALFKGRLAQLNVVVLSSNLRAESAEISSSGIKILEEEKKNRGRDVRGTLLSTFEVERRKYGSEKYKFMRKIHTKAMVARLTQIH